MNLLQLCLHHLAVGTCIATWLGGDWKEKMKLTSLLWFLGACSEINIGEIFTQTVKGIHQTLAGSSFKSVVQGEHQRSRLQESWHSGHRYSDSGPCRNGHRSTQSTSALAVGSLGGWSKGDGHSGFVCMGCWRTRSYLWNWFPYLFKPGKYLFVSRLLSSIAFPTWLKSIPNKYIHFGDFDLAGIDIYLHFFNDISDRASFLIPEDIEERIKTSGNSSLYYTHEERYKEMNVTDRRVQSLVDMIHKYHMGYEQEGYAK